MRLVLLTEDASYEENWRRLRGIAEEVARQCPPLPTDTVRGLIAVGELKVALELLLDNLVEADAVPSAALCGELVELAQTLNLDARAWWALRRS